VAREAISALVDGEELPIPESVADAHVSQCRKCREFQAQVLSLTRQLSVRVVPRRTDRTAEILTSLGLSAEALASAACEPAQARRGRLTFARATQWAAGFAPLVLAVPALALGAFAHTHIVPSHDMARCMMSLSHRWR